MELRILNEILAIEIVGVLRYKRGESAARKVYSYPLADEFKKLAHDDQRLVDVIVGRINQLAGEPNFTPVGHLMGNHSEYNEGSSLQEMLKENWVAERKAIDSCREMIRLLHRENSSTRRILENIMTSKNERADVLIKLLTSLGSRTVNSSLRQSESLVNAGGRL